MPLVSVIIPVYNVEKYIERCISSVVNQSYKNLQIILVNDGSKDTSGAICEKWKNKDNRISVIHKQNEGLGYARNTGLQVATGKYCSFIDSDDYIKTNMYEKVIAQLEKEQADICYYGLINVWTNKTSEIKEYPTKLVYVGEAILRDLFVPAIGAVKENFINVSVCTAIYRLGCIRENSIMFNSEKVCLCEDLFFNINYSALSKKAIVFPESFYYYCHNSNSLSTSYRSDRFEATIRHQKLLESNMKKYNIRDFASGNIDRCLMINTIVCLKQEVSNERILGKKTVINNLKKICNDNYIQNYLLNNSMNNLPITYRLLKYALKNKIIPLVYIFTKMKTKK